MSVMVSCAKPTIRLAALRSSVALATLVFGVPAHSQSQSAGTGSGAAAAPGTPLAANAGPGTAGGGGIEEIIVTAQRRAESAQSIPVSVEAISGAQIRAQDITDATRLEQVVPGLRLSRSGPSTRPAIRGVYTEAIGINADPRIGFYIDEIYQSRPAQGDAAFVDLERVEVQKGPQGTLFGRNSLGGNIALTSATPKDHLEGGIDVLGGSYARGKVEAFFNTPLADGLDFRIAGEAERHNGYLKSVVNSRADLEDKGQYFVRGSLRWAPPSLDGRFEVLLHAAYFDERDNGYNNINAKVIGALVDPSLIRAPGQPLVVNGITYPLPAGYNGGNYATGILLPYTTALRDNIPDIGGADIGLPIPGPYKSVYDFPAFQRQTSQNYSATINFDVADGIRFRSITGYADFSSTNAGDGDGGPVPISEYYQVTKAKTFSQEFQVQSTSKSSPLQYTVGAFFLNDIDDDDSTLHYFHSYTTAGAAAAGLPALYAGGSACGFTYLPNTTSCAFGNGNSLNAADSPGPEHATTNSYALYGQASYRITPKLTVTGGVRYTIDDKTFLGVAQTSDFVGTYVANQNAAFLAANPNATQAQLPFPTAASVPSKRPNGLPTGFVAGLGYHAQFPLAGNSATFENRNCGGVTPGPFAPSGSNTVVGQVPDYFQTRCGQASFRFFTYRGAVDYKIDSDHLVYASYSTGVHSGGFGGSYVPTTLPQGLFAAYGPETVDAFEIGSKNQFFDNRLQLNVVAFYNHYKKVQIQGLQFIADTNGGLGTNITTIYNGPSEDAPGVDIELVAKPTRALTVNFAANYLHARYDVYPQPVYYSGLCTISSGGGGPCTGFSGPTYVATMGGLGSGFFPNALTDPSLFVPVKNNAGNVIGYQSLIFGKKTRVQNTPDIAIHFGASYEIDLGSAGRITPDFESIYSGSYLLSASTPLFTQRPYIKTDARVSYVTANNKFSAQVFVENLENTAVIGRVTTASLAASGTFEDPRTYGIKLGYRF